MVYFLCKASDSGRQNCYFALSLPVRGAWVEMRAKDADILMLAKSLPVRGAWVEITTKPVYLSLTCGRSPCGERGLKFDSHIGKIC